MVNITIPKFTPDPRIKNIRRYSDLLRAGALEPGPPMSQNPYARASAAGAFAKLGQSLAGRRGAVEASDLEQRQRMAQRMFGAAISGQPYAPPAEVPRPEPSFLGRVGRAVLPRRKSDADIYAELSGQFPGGTGLGLEGWRRAPHELGVIAGANPLAVAEFARATRAAGAPESGPSKDDDRAFLRQNAPRFVAGELTDLEERRWGGAISRIYKTTRSTDARGNEVVNQEDVPFYLRDAYKERGMDFPVPIKRIPLGAPEYITPETGEPYTSVFEVPPAEILRSFDLRGTPQSIGAHTDTMFNQASKLVGVPAGVMDLVRAVPGLGDLFMGPEGLAQQEARQKYAIAWKDLIHPLVQNPRMPVAEMDWVKELVADPMIMWTNPKRFQARMIGLDHYLEGVMHEKLYAAASPHTRANTRESLVADIRQLQGFRQRLGVPKRVTTKDQMIALVTPGPDRPPQLEPGSIFIAAWPDYRRSGDPVPLDARELDADRDLWELLILTHRPGEEFLNKATGLMQEAGAGGHAVPYFSVMVDR